MFLQDSSNEWIHQISIRERDEWKIYFRTNHRLHKWLIVMHFSHSNPPNTFTRLISKLLKQFASNFVIVNLDDILIYIQIKEWNMIHIWLVLNTLQWEIVLINLKKCSFMKKELVYLGFMIFEDGLMMNQEIVKEINKFHISSNFIELRISHGLTSFIKKLLETSIAFVLIM